MFKVSNNDYIPLNSVAQILAYDTESAKQKVKKYRDEGNILLSDCTRRKKIRSIIIQTNGGIILTSYMPETLSKRYIAALQKRNDRERMGENKKK